MRELSELRQCAEMRVVKQCTGIEAMRDEGDKAMR
jgi:hypothetical protein